MRGWLLVGWHVGGMSWDRYLRLTIAQRWILHEELGDLIDLATPEAPTAEG